MIAKWTRIALVGIFAATTVSLGVAGSSVATAAPGSAGAGGGAYVGETLVATAWESSLAPFTVSSSPEVHSDDSDIYNYRIGITDETIVDYQSTTGLTPLTAEQQEQWYIDSGLAPYEFTWMAFYCPSVRVMTPEPPIAVEGDPGIDIPFIPYRDVSEASGYPTFTDGEFGYWFSIVADGSIFGGDIGLYLPELQSTVATPLIFNDGSPTGSQGPLATSYLNVTCPDGFGPYFGRILNSSSEGDYATGRNLTLGEKLYIEPAAIIARVQPVVELDPANTYVAVTGDSFNSNAALWGVTRVNDGARALPDTGTRDESILLPMAAIAVVLVTLGALLLRLRRRVRR